MSNSPIKNIVLHYSATYPDQDLDVDDIRKMHLARGFNDVGYHYVIKRDGTVQKGRADNVVGAHVAGHNTGSLGVCCIGGIERATGPNVGVDNRTQAQKDATVLLVQNLLKKHPKAKVVGHRDLGPTQCPGFDVQTWWAAVSGSDPSPNPLIELQTVLKRLGLYTGRVDGIDGRMTQAALTAFNAISADVSAWQQQLEN